MVSFQEVLDFWFSSEVKEKWYAKDHGFDRLIADKFGNLIDLVNNGELSNWQSDPKGSLASIIVLDQFTRNIFRDTPKSFAYDKKALLLAKNVINNKHAQEINLSMRSFVYMPFMHSEELSIQEQSLELFGTLKSSVSLKFAKEHYDIIKRFGRFPHRNKILERKSTDQEIKFLEQEHSGF